MRLYIGPRSKKQCGQLYFIVLGHFSDVHHQVGVKPTPGLVSRHLVIPISSTKDTVGPMAGDVATCAAVLQVIAGKDDRDSLTDSIPFEIVPDYLAACKKEALKGARIGWLEHHHPSRDPNSS